MPFKALPGVEETERKEEKEVVSQVTGLSLETPVSEFGSCNLMSKSNGSNQMKTHNKPQQQQQQQQAYRKQRRSWSPELHRRFVDALQQLGGSQGRCFTRFLYLLSLVVIKRVSNCCTGKRFSLGIFSPLRLIFGWYIGVGEI